jgi:delta1-piperideine-2-carboxylate reductase
VLQALRLPIIAAWRCTQQIKDRNLTGKERDGAASHGLLRLLGYVSTLKSGWSTAGRCRPSPTLPGLLATEAANAFAQPEQ